MTTGILRMVVLVLGIVAGVLSAFAHPLPGSKLTLTRAAENVEVTLAIPVPELIVARPSLNGLGGVAKNADLPAALHEDLAAYLQQRVALTLADQSPLNLQLLKAKVENAQHHDVGHYDLLVVQMSAPMQSNRSLFRATLTYYAVLHEVRNHRATVWLIGANKKPALLGKIGFDARVGLARPLVLLGD
ncbi:MAG: hypothetical protein ACRCU5_06925, partial [Rhizobiaceae bacterium]